MTGHNTTPTLLVVTETYTQEQHASLKDRGSRPAARGKPRDVAEHAHALPHSPLRRPDHHNHGRPRHRHNHNDNRNLVTVVTTSSGHMAAGAVATQLRNVEDFHRKYGHRNDDNNFEPQKHVL